MGPKNICVMYDYYDAKKHLESFICLCVGVLMEVNRLQEYTHMSEQAQRKQYYNALYIDTQSN